MKALRALAAIILGLTAWVWAGAAWAEAKIALLVANSSYDARFGVLANPQRDADLVGDALRKAGWQVTIARDLDRAGMIDVLRRHADAVRAAGPSSVSLFYYAGHGASNPEATGSFLIPVGADVVDPIDLPDLTLSLSSVIARLDAAPARARIIIIDACRHFPFARGAAGGKSTGLAEPVNTRGALIVFATDPGKTADDGPAGGNSPFASALAAQIVAPGASAPGLFRAVRNTVLERTGGRQAPFLTDGLTSEIAFAPAAQAQTGSTVVQTASPALLDNTFWEACCKDPGASPARLRAYLNRVAAGELPGLFADIARIRLAEIAEMTDPGAGAPTPVQTAALPPEGLSRSVTPAAPAPSPPAAEPQGTNPLSPPVAVAPAAETAPAPEPVPVAAPPPPPARPAVKVADVMPSLPPAFARLREETLPSGAAEAPFSVAMLAPEVAAAATAAREAAALARSAQGRAQAAARAAAAAAVSVDVGASGVDVMLWGADVCAGSYALNDAGAKVLNGPAECRHGSGERFAGTYAATRREGPGVSWYGKPGAAPDGQYEGDWSAGRRNGHGVESWPSGQRHEGAYAGDQPNGPAVRMFENGYRFEGSFRNNVRDGPGVVWGVNGEVIEQGVYAGNRLVRPLFGPDADARARAREQAARPAGESEAELTEALRQFTPTRPASATPPRN